MALVLGGLFFNKIQQAWCVHVQQGIWVEVPSGTGVNDSGVGDGGFCKEESP